MRGEKPCIFHELKNICDKFDMFLQTYVFEVFNDLRFIQMTLRKLGSTYLIIFYLRGRITRFTSKSWAAVRLRLIKKLNKKILDNCAKL